MKPIRYPVYMRLKNSNINLLIFLSIALYTVSGQSTALFDSLQTSQIPGDSLLVQTAPDTQQVDSSKTKAPFEAPIYY